MPAAFFRVESSIVTEASEKADGRIDHVLLCGYVSIRRFSLSHCLTKRGARHQVFEAGRQIPK